MKIVDEAGSLGICQHCKKIILYTDIPLKHKNDPYKIRCPYCRGLTDIFRSWGYGYNIFLEVEKQRWVGLRGKWVCNRPRRNFIIDKFDVRI